MNVGVKFLKVDIVIQRILIVIYLISGFFGFVVSGLFIITLLTQLAIGAWQLLSAIIFSISGNKRRITYLIAVVCYIILTTLGFILVEKRILQESFALFIVGMIVVPLIMAAWYHVITFQHYDESIKNQNFSKSSKFEMEDILDSGELF